MENGNGSGSGGNNWFRSTILNSDFVLKPVVNLIRMLCDRITRVRRLSSILSPSSGISTPLSLYHPRTTRWPRLSPTIYHLHMPTRARMTPFLQAEERKDTSNVLQCPGANHPLTMCKSCQLCNKWFDRPSTLKKVCSFFDRNQTQNTHAQTSNSIRWSTRVKKV